MPDGVLTEAGVAFEVDRLEMQGERLELSGRWYGVRGRRFMRPTLTLIGADGQTRCLAELEDKPWAAEDGESWQAAFTVDPPDQAVTELELAVAPDIAVFLEPPSDLPRRAAAPRGRKTRPVAATPAPAAPPVRQAPDPAPAKRAERRIETLAAERDQLEATLTRARAELERSRADAAAAAADAAAARTEAAAAQAGAVALRDELRAAQADAAAQQADTDLVEGLQRRIVEAERDRAAILVERDRSITERDLAIGERDRAIGERDRATKERDRAINQRDRAVEDRERESAAARQTRAISSRLRREPAAHMFRRPANDGWPQRIAVLTVLLMAVIALLIIFQSS